MGLLRRDECWVRGHGDPGMRELQEGGATCSEKESGFAVDFPTDGVCAEDAGERIRDVSLD